MQYHVNHTTTYEYSEPVSLCQNLAHLTPRDVANQLCLQSDLRITPEPQVMANRIDYFGNPACFFAIQKSHRRLIIEATHDIDVSESVTPDPATTPAWEEVRDLLPIDTSPPLLEAVQYVYDSRYIKCGSELAEYALPSFPSGLPILQAAIDLTRRIHTDFKYDPRATTVATPLREVLHNRRGVCQDFAHLQIGCLRSLGLAARYISGYLSTKPPPGRKRLVGADATHAWVSIYCHGFGWIDLDPTNNQVPSDQHLLLAWGRDFDDVSPIKGVILGGGQHTVKVGVDVATRPAEVEDESVGIA